MDKRFALRLAFVAIMLILFYQMRMHIETIALIGILFIGFIFLREKMGKAAEHILENHLPFTKKWPDWAEKALLFAIFIVLYLILKQIIYTALGFFGIDLSAIILEAMQNMQ